MRDNNGDNYGTIIDNSTNYIIKNKQKNNITHSTSVEKEEVSLKAIIKEKIIEGIIGTALTAISSFYFCGNEVQSKIDNLLSGNKTWLIIIMLVFLFIGIFLSICFIIDFLPCLKLRQKGAFIEITSKRWHILIALESLVNIAHSNLRKCDKAYLNIDGKIYLIKSKGCPKCQTEPIGKMKLHYNIKRNRYQWICSENSNHIFDFDHKTKM